MGLGLPGVGIPWGRTRPPSCCGCSQANELTDQVVGAPKAPCDQPLQLSQVQGAVGQVWEGGSAPCNLQVWGCRG